MTMRSAEGAPEGVFLRRDFAVSSTPSKDERVVDVVASTAAIDSYGEIVSQDSWDLRRFEANPVVLYGHDRKGLPIGRAESVGVKDGALHARIRFASAAVNPLAEQVYQAFREGVLNAVSVGFRSKKGVLQKLPDGGEALMLTDNELLEVSVVPVPANPEAVAQERAKSIESIRALVTASSPPQEKTNMREVARALGMPDDASEAAVVSGIREILAITGRSSKDEVVAAVSEWRARAAQADALAAEMLAMRSVQREAEVERMLDDAFRTGKLPPADRARALAAASADGTGTNVTPEALRRVLDLLSVKVNVAGATRTPAPTEDGISLSEEDLYVIKSGSVSREQFIAARKREIALRTTGGQ